MINVSTPGGVSSLFVRSKVVKGRTYYQAVETYRDPKDGRVRHRTLASLGTHPTIKAACQDAEARYFAARRGHKRAPLTVLEAKLWDRLATLCNLLLDRKDKTYRMSPAMREENRRLIRFRERQERAWRKWERWQKRAQEHLKNQRGIQAVWYSLLGLIPPATVGQIKAAYRAKAREYHPDHGGTDAMMAEINNAYEGLLDLARAEEFRGHQLESAIG